MNFFKNIILPIDINKSGCSCGSHESGCGGCTNSEKTEGSHNYTANGKDKSSSK